MEVCVGITNNEIVIGSPVYCRRIEYGSIIRCRTTSVKELMIYRDYYVPIYYVKTEHSVYLLLKDEDLKGGNNVYIGVTEVTPKIGFPLVCSRVVNDDMDMLNKVITSTVLEFESIEDFLFLVNTRNSHYILVSY